MNRLKWHTPATDYPNKKVGKAKVFKYRCAPGHSYWAEGVRGLMTYRFEPGHNKITELTIDGHCWMTDMPQYYWSMEYFAEQSKGHVVVAGLGLGLVVHCLVKNPAVESITVIEREPDVIKLIKPLLPDDLRIEIIERDFYWWLTADPLRRDTVIWDLAVWGLPEEGKHSEGYPQIFVINDMIETKYGKDCLCFRHGLDRDPAGTALVKTERYQRSVRIYTGRNL